MSGLVTLRTDDAVPDVLMRTVCLSLEHLFEREPIAFYELVMSCRDRDHALFGNTGAKLTERSLIDGTDKSGRGHIRTDIRAIVLAATEGDAGDMHLRSPLTESGAA